MNEIDAALFRLSDKRNRCRDLLASSVPDSLRGIGESIAAVTAKLDREIEQLLDQRHDGLC